MEKKYKAEVLNFGYAGGPKKGDIIEVEGHENKYIDKDGWFYELISGLQQIRLLGEILENSKQEDLSVSIKKDNGKPDFTDVPLEAMWQMSQAFTFGQKKYEKSNFKKSGMKVSRQLAAALRHIYQHLDGEDIDPDSQCPHLGNAMASLAMAIYNLKHHPEMDDRFEADKKKYEV